MPLVFLQVSTWGPEFVADIRAHYTNSRGAPVGKKIGWRILEDGRMRGYIAIGEPSFKLAARRRLGLMDARPLPHTVGNWFYRLVTFEGARASEILREWHPVASDDWEQRYGWRPVHWETMVDESEVKTEVAGYCYRRAGYRSLGYTTGRTARRPAGARALASSGKGWGAMGPRVWTTGTKKLVLYRGPLARVGNTGALA